MKVKIPKELVGASYPTVMTLVLAEINTETFLPSLFFKVMSGGRSRLKGENDEKTIATYVEKLANHPLLIGFQTPDGHRILEKFVRTSLITTGGIGRAKRGEQILALTPYSLLSYKPELFGSNSRQRGVDTFIYRVLLEHVRVGDSLENTQRKLRDNYFIKFFGKGLKFDQTPNSVDGKYNEQTELDTLTRMSLAFIDGFTATKPGRESDTSKPSPCPTLVTQLAQDILLFLNTYAERMPSQALTYYFQALISFEMYIYSLRLATAVNALVRNPSELPFAMRDPVERSDPLIYLDFTGQPKHLSEQMAAECVRRDVETFQQFFRSLLQLRWLDKQVAKFKKAASTKLAVEQLLQGKSNGAAYLQSMLQMREDIHLKYSFNAAAQHDIASIQLATLPNAEGDETEANWLDEITEPARTDIDQLVLLLEEGQRQSILKNYIGWILGIGGMNKTYGLLSGSSRQRRTWRYAPGNDLLSLLVQLATAHAIPQEQRGSDAGPSEIRLQEFLHFLEDRYGIIVSRPPPGIHGAECSAAAHSNLRAMLSRLRQMGIFTDLSDDFTVQRLRPPYGDPITTIE